jgi:hypothetical protein
MGRKSGKSDAEKTPYEKAREKCGLTREKASERMDYISADRIEKIENGRASANPEDVLAMAEAYEDSLLCNYYCSRECPIGRKHVPYIEIKDLSRITLETLSTLNSLNQLKDRFVDISVDDKITEDELDDFMLIREKLENISLTADTLRYWMEQNLPDREENSPS